MARMPHSHICAECDECEQEEGVEIISRSEDGFEAIIRSQSQTRIRVQ